MNIPSGWQLLKLSKILETLESGSRPKGGAQGITSGVPSISAEHMTNFGTFDFSNIRYVPREFYNSMNRGHIKKEDILIVKDGATTGKTCFVDENFPFTEAVCNEHVFICRPRRSIAKPKFLFYYVWSPEGQYQILQTFQGAAIGGINQRFVDMMNIPLPPLAEQKRITAILNEQMAAVEQARQAAQARLEAAQALPPAYLRQIFPQPGQPLPSGWKLMILENVCEIISGQHILEADYNQDGEGIGYLTGPADFGRIKPLITKWSEKPRVTCEPSDVLVTVKGAGVGKVNLSPDEPVAIGRQLMALRPHSSSLNRIFLFYFLLTCFDHFQENALGATVPGLDREDLKSLQVPLPSIFEQQRLVNVLNQQMIAIEQASQAAKEQLQEINALPAALLRRAFNGEL